MLAFSPYSQCVFVCLFGNPPDHPKTHSLFPSGELNSYNCTKHIPIDQSHELLSAIYSMSISLILLFRCSASSWLWECPGFPWTKLSWGHKYFSSRMTGVMNCVPSWPCNTTGAPKVRKMSRSCRVISAAFFDISGQRTKNLVMLSCYTIIHFKLPRHKDCILLKSTCPHAKCSLLRTDQQTIPSSAFFFLGTLHRRIWSAQQHLWWCLHT